ncbi:MULTISPECIES: alpha/beta fold hydrolase [unclassified Haematospirillum]|uniref:alpha/beta fold hydrolase n=1 Tax=unclassified Haematospirillum TaxID=2622088 RepID=UPI00143AAEFA|nr:MULTISPECIES: alpha/beta hydrolase [unclassified Haematospirillum]NKD55517.1 alpha/beta hydrolase [Haematospirillum sp. H4890]NKD75657.1 alpha/beta hydrolase [Haematospirillum sp. H4485]
MTRILLLHGWAGSAKDWKGVQANLPNDLDTECPDAGYFGQQKPWSGHRPDLVVGYSLGCLDALGYPDLNGIPWIAVNGFTRFCAGTDFPEGVPVRILQRMRKQLDEDTASTVITFLSSIGASRFLDDSVTYNHKALSAGLTRLLEADRRPAQPALALAGDRDPLVSVAHSRACFGDSAAIIQEGGHRLLHTHPHIVANAIVRIIRS